MSDKIFVKDITLPIVETGENETYSFVQTDSDLETAGDAADAKKVGDELTQLKEDFTQLDETAARIDGSYDTMTVGNAKQLTSNVGINDKAPYLFRTAGGANDIGDREEDTIVGGSVVHNQLVENGDFSDGTTGWSPYLSANGSIAVSNGTLTYTVAVAGSSGYGFGFQRSLLNRPVIGHKYLYCASVRFSVSGVKAAFEFGGSEPSNVAFRELTANTWTSVAYIVSASASSNRGFMVKPKGGSLEEGSTMDYRNIMLTDLTAMFGSTIADYVYTLESATAGSGIAWLQKYGFFTKDYYPYSAPTFKHVEGLASHKMTGFNQWDEEWELGIYDLPTGAKINNSTNIRSKNLVPVFPNTTYCWNNPDSNVIRWVYFNANKERIGSWSSTQTSPVVFTTSADTHYMAFYLGGTTYTGNLCISLHWDGERDGEYEAYKVNTYPLDDSLTLRGIPKLDANNDLYYDGDVYVSDGSVMHKYAVKVLDGSEEWQTNTVADGLFYVGSVAFVGIKGGGDIFSDKFIETTVAGSAMVNGEMKIVSTNVNFKTSYATVDAWKTALASNPVTLLYELGTPTTESADPFQTPQVVDDWGTEEYVYSDGAFPIPVGHNTFYAANLKAKLEMAPDSPGDGDGDYIVRQTNGLNEYVKMVKELPSAPTTDGSYHLEVTVASGTPTLAWVADE